jgi:hypothetical protein
LAGRLSAPAKGLKQSSLRLESRTFVGCLGGNMSTQALVARYEALPPAGRRKVQAFIKALSAAQTEPRPQKQKRFTFDWAGGLEDLKEQFTAVELQHHLRELR